MPLSVNLNPTPQVVAHDPLGRAMSEEQRLRLREQPSPPVEETLAKERIGERRRKPQDEKSSAQDQQDDDDREPGGIIDSYA